MDLAASGVSASTLAGKIKDREVQIAKLDRQLKQPRHAPPNISKLRGALQQRAEEWRTDLRAEPELARMVLRLVGPLTMTDLDDNRAFIEWAASVQLAYWKDLPHPYI